ncbi:hypothetical protein RHSIM_Rhsim05G0129600 [Rhododendron simsii]|uniref:Sey1/RHD3-like three-helix bundle domain-containing protein n=1 Tax=Rhododendron simsii TaxID=118357 RepID=A0A834GZ14_RHOSS|nr:hypothetical protein RHSIM_Rhsim05G0129600 [Rhododendron simsii]
MLVLPVKLPISRSPCITIPPVSVHVVSLVTCSPLQYQVLSKSLLLFLIVLESRLASSAAGIMPVPASKRDDSLVLQHDGIHGTFCHRKRLCNSTRGFLLVIMDVRLHRFLVVEVKANLCWISNYEVEGVCVAQLRQRFFPSIAPGGLAGDRRGVVPSSGFSFSAQQKWKVIKENRDLDLLTRCEEIASDKLRCLTSDEVFMHLFAVWVAFCNKLEIIHYAFLISLFRISLVGIGGSHSIWKLSSILDMYLSKYDREAFYFDELVRKAKRQQLESKHCRDADRPKR